MKKTVSMLLATAMLCGTTLAYPVAGGAISATPATIQTDLSESMSTLGIAPFQPVAGANDVLASTVGSAIRVDIHGKDTRTSAITAFLDTTKKEQALPDSRSFGGVCAAIVKLVAPSTNAQAVSAALQLDQTEGNGQGNAVRTFASEEVLFTYQSTDKGVRFTAVPMPEDRTGIKLMVNDTFLDLDTAPRIVSGRTLVPVRGIFEHLGATVGWDVSTRTVTVTKGELKVALQIDSTTAQINGQAKTLDVPAQLSSKTGAARTLVPLRFISESIGASVGWNAQTQTVVIYA